MVYIIDVNSLFFFIIFLFLGKSRIPRGQSELDNIFSKIHFFKMTQIRINFKSKNWKIVSNFH